MTLFFGKCFILYFFKLSAGLVFCQCLATSFLPPEDAHDFSIAYNVLYIT